MNVKIFFYLFIFFRKKVIVIGCLSGNFDRHRLKEQFSLIVDYFSSKYSSEMYYCKND